MKLISLCTCILYCKFKGETSSGKFWKCIDKQCCKISQNAVNSLEMQTFYHRSIKVCREMNFNSTWHSHMFLPQLLYVLSKHLHCINILLRVLFSIFLRKDCIRNLKICIHYCKVFELGPIFYRVVRHCCIYGWCI